MQKTERVEIRLLFESDIPAAMKLKEAAGWNQTEDDWRRLVMLEPNGCFAAIKDGQLVGTTTTTTYGDDLAWIGMVLVDPQIRRLGIATTLMETALNYLDRRVATVKLDATSQGKPVYERFGFKFESLVERWSGKVEMRSIHREITPLNLVIRRELLALDRRGFGADRSKLIESLIDDSPIPPVLVRDKNRILNGYALARKGTKADYIGPVVTTDAAVVESLLDQMLGQLSGSSVYIDFSNECGTSSSVLSDRGFVKERDLIRMSSGGRPQKTSPFVIAIAGPEIG
jgi:GNAT superfamily N-acetyltransferase